MSALRDALRDLSEDVFFDLLESDDAYLLVLDVPGVTADSLDLSTDGGSISIDARRTKSPADDYDYLEEDRQPALDLELPMPADASETGSEAIIERGVLKLTIPKQSTATETMIDVVDGDT